MNDMMKEKTYGVSVSRNVTNVLPCTSTVLLILRFQDTCTCALKNISPEDACRFKVFYFLANQIKVMQHFVPVSIIRGIRCVSQSSYS